MKNDITASASILIHATADKVWEALTTPELIRQYFPGTEVVSEWKEGSPLLFKGEEQGRSYRDKGMILNIIPGKLLRYTRWSSLSGLEDKPYSYAIITCELLGKNGNTALTIVQENVPDEKTKEQAEDNWEKVLDNLKKFLEPEPEEYWITEVLRQSEYAYIARDNFLSA